MAQSWPERHEQLLSILEIVQGIDEDDRLGLALDEGRVKKQVTHFKFSNRDLRVIGVLDAGQYSTIDVVKCRLNGGLYVRKSIDKVTVRRCYQQCFPQTERDILLLARRMNAHFIPHLIAAFQSQDSLYLIMPYGSGGTLWDVLESSSSCVSEIDLKWWIPQAVSAISWCHDQGFGHRDIKPHNFVITPSSHILLIDFGSAAPLLPPISTNDKRRLIPRQFCRAPCGTCDYIAPEVLEYFEQDMIKFEAGESSTECTTADDEASSTAVSQSSKSLEGSYGMEVDWWSLGVLVYELYYGVTPFFADDVRKTYERIVHHQVYLKFDSSRDISPELKQLLRGFIQDKEVRLGRNGAKEVEDQAFLKDVRWSELHLLDPPVSLHLPRFAYTEDAQEGLALSIGHSRAPSLDPEYTSQSRSRPFNFSQFFRSSTGTRDDTVRENADTHQQAVGQGALIDFVGFSWGPPSDAFSFTITEKSSEQEKGTPNDFQKIHMPRLSHSLTHYDRRPFFTPIRANPQMFPQTFPRSGTVYRTIGRRGMTDREAMDALVEHIGMSAQKKVMESGKKPRSMGRTAFRRSLESGLKAKRKPIPLTLRFQLDENDSRRISSIRERGYASEEDDTGSSALPSPSPTPRPNSALSNTLTFTRRSLTPVTNNMTTTDGFLSVRNPTPTISDSRHTISPEGSKSVRRVASESIVYDASLAMKLYREEGLSFNDRGLEIMDNRLANLQRKLDLINRKLDSISFDQNGQLRQTRS